MKKAMKQSGVFRDTIFVFFILLLAYVYMFPRWADWNQTSRLNLVRALVELNTVRIDEYVTNTGDYVIHNGHVYTDKAPGPSFIAVPFYFALRPVLEHPAVSVGLERIAKSGALEATLKPEGEGITVDRVREFVAQYLLTLIVVAIPTAAAAALLYNFLTTFDVSRGWRLTITLGYGLATPAATYAWNFYSHQLTAALCLSAFALLVWLRQGTGGAPRALLAGLLLGYAAISEYPSVIIGAILAIYAFRFLPLSKSAWFVAGGLVPLALLVMYDLTAFQTPWPMGFNHSTAWESQHEAGYLGIVYPQLEAIWGLTFGTFRGIFVRAPWLALALPGVVIWWRRETFRAELVVVLSVVVSLILLYASSEMWWGGFAAGPRYLTPILPFLALGAAPTLLLAWEENMRWHRLARAGGVVLALASALLTWSEAVAGQMFPPSGIQNPWIDYVLPVWEKGDVARNLGMLLGFSGGWSMLLFAGLIGGLVLWFATNPPSSAGMQDGQAPKGSISMHSVVGQH